MKIFIASLSLLLIIILLSSCSTKQAKIAVVQNSGYDDQTLQFFDGAVSEAKALGYIADTFVTDSDDKKMQEILQKVLNGDYAGIIVSHGKKEYSYDLIKKASDKGIKVVAYDTLSERIPGVTFTFQDDISLARLSLKELIQKSSNYPVRIIKLMYNESFPSSKARNSVYEEYEKKGLITTVAEIDPDVPPSKVAEYVRNEIRFSNIEADGIWAPWDELAKGVYSGLTDIGRFDIPIASIGISDNDIACMHQRPDVWIASAAVNALEIGTINMRILAKEIKGESTFENFYFDASLIKSSNLRPISTVANLGTIIDGFGNCDAFIENWMIELRKKNLKNIVMISNSSDVPDNKYKELNHSGLGINSNKANIIYRETSNNSNIKSDISHELRLNPDLIWCTISTAADSVLKSANENSNIMFACNDCYFDNPPKNLLGLSFRTYEGAFLAGYIAAKATQTGTVGFIGGKDFPIIKRIEDGYKQGVLYADPNVELLSSYVGSFYDKERGAALALNQYQNGADVIFQAAGPSGLGVIDAAKSADKWIIGNDYDQTALAPNNVLTSVIKQSDAAIGLLIDKYLSGENIFGKNYVYGLSENSVSLTPNNGNIPDELYNEMLKVKDKIISGEIKIDLK